MVGKHHKRAVLRGSNLKYDLDEIIDRSHTYAERTDGCREYIFFAGPEMEIPYADGDFARIRVADLDFATPPDVCQAIKPGRQMHFGHKPGAGEWIFYISLGAIADQRPGFYEECLSAFKDGNDWLSVGKQTDSTRPGESPAHFIVCYSVL